MATGGGGELSGSVTIPGLGDPQFSNVSLLLHMDGSGSTFTDSSGTPKTITASGDATQSSTQSKFGGKSAYLDGTGDYLTSTSDGYAFGTGDFTVECWAYNTESLANISNGLFQIGNSTTTPGVSGVAVGISGNHILYHGGNSPSESAGNYTVGSVSAPVNQWTHYALVRSGSTLTLYVNGQSQISITYTANLTVNNLSIGLYYDTDNLWQGYIDEFRITKSARYTASFTPPTAPFNNG